MAYKYQKQFEAYHERHPEVYDHLVSLCYRLQAKGRSRYGLKALWEQTRWHFDVECDEGFKCNNNFQAYYARKIMAEHPALNHFFETRVIRAHA